MGTKVDGFCALYNIVNDDLRELRLAEAPALLRKANAQKVLF